MDLLLRFPFRCLGLLAVCIVSLNSLRAAEAEDFSFPQLQGWTQEGTEASWGRDNLYVPIDGAADLFLRYAFERMRSRDYRNAAGDTIGVEVYRHATSLDAFGIYSQGRPVRKDYLPIGVQAYGESDSLTILAGRYYLELRSSADNDASRQAMRTLGEKLAAGLTQGARLPEVFDRFPREGRKPCSEKYLAVDILGYSFFSHAYQSDYSLAGGNASLFAMIGQDEQACSSRVRDYLASQRLPSDTPLAGVVEIKDRFHGAVLLLREGGNLLLCVGDAPLPERKALLLALRTSLLHAQP